MRLWYNSRKAAIILIKHIYHNGAARLWYNSRKAAIIPIKYIMGKRCRAAWPPDGNTREATESVAGKKEKSKASRRGKRADTGKRERREERYAYDRAVSSLGGVVCALAVISVGTIVLLIAYAALFMA